MREQVFRTISRVYPTERVGTNPLLKWVWRALFYTLRPRQPFIMRTRDYRLHAHPQKGTLTRGVLLSGRYEPVLTRAFQGFLKHGALVVDAGANFGHYALVAAHQVGTSGRVIAFEPNPETHELLTSNARLVPSGNISVEQAGLSDETSTAGLVVDARNPGGHSFSARNVAEEGATVQVPIYRLDDYLVERGIEGPVDLLKIDVQGYELKLLRGASTVLRRDRPVVFCEIAPRLMSAVGDDYHALLELFEELDYEAAVVDNPGGRVRTVSYHGAAALLSAVGSDHADFMFVPQRTEFGATGSRVASNAR